MHCLCKFFLSNLASQVYDSYMIFIWLYTGAVYGTYEAIRFKVLIWSALALLLMRLCRLHIWLLFVIIFALCQKIIFHAFFFPLLIWSFQMKALMFLWVVFTHCMLTLQCLYRVLKLVIYIIWPYRRPNIARIAHIMKHRFNFLVIF